MTPGSVRLSARVPHLVAQELDQHLRSRPTEDRVGRRIVRHRRRDEKRLPRCVRLRQGIAIGRRLADRRLRPPEAEPILGLEARDEPIRHREVDQRERTRRRPGIQAFAAGRPCSRSGSIRAANPRTRTARSPIARACGSCCRCRRSPSRMRGRGRTATLDKRCGPSTACSRSSMMNGLTCPHPGCAAKLNGGVN